MTLKKKKSFAFSMSYISSNKQLALIVCDQSQKNCLRKLFLRYLNILIAGDPTDAEYE